MVREKGMIENSGELERETTKSGRSSPDHTKITTSQKRTHYLRFLVIPSRGEGASNQTQEPQERRQTCIGA